MSRNPVIETWLGKGIIADNFAGGGGVSEAFRRALGRSPDHAINHDPEALAMHEANHPETKHHVANVWDVDPSLLIGNEEVLAAWFSPDCKDHSSAKGGKPIRDKEIRALAWVAVRWAKAVKPKWIFIENVPEFREWGPVHQTHTDGCDPELEGGLIICSIKCRFGQRIASRKGQIYRGFLKRLRSFYKNVDGRILRASDYGSPTSRKRFFLVASDEPIVWPLPTHGPMLSKPHRTAAECIDWSVPCPSIFMTSDEAREYTEATGVRIKRPLVDNTLARIAAGTKQFVLDDPQPFLVPIAHGPKGKPDRRTHSVNEPLPTITADRRGDFAVIVPMLVQTGYGEREGQRPRWMDIRQPIGTIVAGGSRHALASVFLSNGNSLRETGGSNVGHSAGVPMSTITTQRQKSLVAVGMREDFDRSRATQIAAFLIRYNGTSGAQSLRSPLSTIDTTDRFGLVTVVIDGRTYVIDDIGYRILDPIELSLATGFAREYVLDPIYNGKPLSRTAQIRMIGNAVPPDVAAAVIGANVRMTTPSPRTP